jgi:hypothetical protein
MFLEKIKMKYEKMEPFPDFGEHFIFKLRRFWRTFYIQNFEQKVTPNLTKFTQNYSKTLNLFREKID